MTDPIDPRPGLIAILRTMTDTIAGQIRSATPDEFERVAKRVARVGELTEPATEGFEFQVVEVKVGTVG